jgi:hypothetical protein
MVANKYKLTSQRIKKAGRWGKLSWTAKDQVQKEGEGVATVIAFVMVNCI